MPPRLWDRRRNEIVKMLSVRPYTADELAEHFGVARKNLVDNMAVLTRTRRVLGIGTGGHPPHYEINPRYPYI